MPAILAMLTAISIVEVSDDAIARDPWKFEISDTVTECPDFECVIGAIVGAALSPSMPSTVICDRVEGAMRVMNEYACRLCFGDPNERMEQLLNASEDLREIEKFWRQYWFADQLNADKPCE